MRAEFLPSSLLRNPSPGELVLLTGEEAHHLSSVVRIKEGEEVLLLDGTGGRFTSVVEHCSKKSVTMRITGAENVPRAYVLDLAIGPSKREAMDDILRMSAELGVRKVIPLITAHSFFPPKDQDRPRRIFINACKQSNNPYLPVLEEAVSPKMVMWQDYASITIFSSRVVLDSFKTKDSNGTVPNLLVLGPEAGFTVEEEDFMFSLSGTRAVHFPSPILRAPTAVAAAAGYFFGRLLKSCEG